MIGARKDGLTDLPARQQRDEVLDVIVMRMAQDRHVNARGADALERGVNVRFYEGATGIRLTAAPAPRRTAIREKSHARGVPV